MPTICSFYGVFIRMYPIQKEHNPPHVHIVYNEHISAVNLLDVTEMYGDIPGKLMNLVLDWIREYRDELLNIWNTQQFQALPPPD